VNAVCACGAPEEIDVHLEKELGRAQPNLALDPSNIVLTAAFRLTSAGLVQTDLTGQVLLANDSCCRIVGRSHGELSTLRWQDLVHPGDLPDGAESFRGCADEGADFAVELRYVRPVGLPRWIRTSGALVRDAEDRPHSILMTLCDVTEHHRAEDDLMDADRRKDEFLAILSHELRNPLGCLKNSLEIIKHAGDQQELLDRAYAIMERQRVQMQQVIDDLQAMTRLSRGKLEVHRQRITLATVLREAIEATRPQIDAARHEVGVTIRPEADDLEADPVRLVQVFSNLLSNACKYTAPGGRITVIAERQGGDVAVSVKDTGIGISPDHLPTLFTIFTQVDSGFERSKGGLGIGLTLVRGLVELHGGTVTAHSEGLGRGSEFVVRLPAAAPATPRVLCP
jgi:two-component system CheB/CheR fusion protein